jgi:hypothetical protein
MFGKLAFLALAFFLVLAFFASLSAPMKSLAQDAGVSGIPHGPGSVGGVNNSINDPSGIGNAARIPPPASPSISVPVVPSAPQAISSRRLPAAARIVTKVHRRTAALSRRERRGLPSHETVRPRHKPIDRELSICRGC